jgi:dCTP deaminase
MILSAHEISRRMETGGSVEKLIIAPYAKECQQPASYDLRAADDIILARGTCTLVPSMEQVEFPRDVAGTIRCRSSFGRRGVLMGAGFVDPGFRGQLTLCLTNMGPEDISVKQGERIVQLIFHEVKNGAELYSGRYQDSVGAVGAKGT